MESWIDGVIIKSNHSVFHSSSATFLHGSEYQYYGNTMTELDKVDRTAIRKVKISKSKNDFQFWQQQPFLDRLVTLESIRQEYHGWKYGTQPGFQRVYTIIKDCELIKLLI